MRAAKRPSAQLRRGASVRSGSVGQLRAELAVRLLAEPRYQLLADVRRELHQLEEGRMNVRWARLMARHHKTLQAEQAQPLAAAVLALAALFRQRGSLPKLPIAAPRYGSWSRVELRQLGALERYIRGGDRSLLRHIRLCVAEMRREALLLARSWRPLDASVADAFKRLVRAEWLPEPGPLQDCGAGTQRAHWKRATQGRR